MRTLSTEGGLGSSRDAFAESAFGAELNDPTSHTLYPNPSPALAIGA